MIAFLTICYSALVWLIFIKLRLLPWNRGSQGAVVGIGIAAIFALLVSMNLFQPYSTDVRVYQPVVEIVPRVTGRVVELAVEANQNVKAGDLLFRVDPDPFQYEVDRLTANLRLKKIILEDAKALTGAQVAAEIKRDRAQAEYDQTRAQLESARWSLQQATVVSPADGIITNLSLRPGQVASQLASMAVMSVIKTGERMVIASYPQSALPFVRVDDPVEIAFDRLPGQILTGRVMDLVPGTGQGQLSPSGQLMSWTDTPVPGRFGVSLALDEASPQDELPAGASGAAAIYTDRGNMISIIRRIVIRMTTWLNYVIL
jgi:multidrug resistance efflux pump